MPAANSTPLKYFYLLFSIELIKEIVRRTNSYARNVIRKGAATAKRYARMKSWRRLTENELKYFLAIGLIRKSSIEEYWNSSLPSQASHWFKKVMSRNRFQDILKFLYVSDYSRNVPRQHPAYDPASRFRPLLSFMNKQFCRFIVPKKEVYVDETLMATKGHNVMKQDIPSTSTKFGIKGGSYRTYSFCMLCESATGYILQMSVYRWRHFNPVTAGQLQGTTVVMNLMSASNILNRGYHVFCDSFVCSQNLASRLIQTTTYITGSYF
ncbi:piggyBac transposable element-derived protein 4-like [Mytilus edulis]|uniref:piggyBac transposable element-derived protein 4-like n=1 Tax=Mytilus edulis TaxID=6550 RepID=UPI0039F01CE4